MNKEKFLEELQGYLHILEDQEQEDILAEYAQHIDMKLQKGLSEEEAIRDFGPMEELAAEILEAYHVKPEFRRRKMTLGLPGLAKANAAEKTKPPHLSGHTFGQTLKEKLKTFCRSIKKGFQWIGGKLHSFAVWFIKPFRRKKGQQAEEGGFPMSDQAFDPLSNQPSDPPKEHLPASAKSKRPSPGPFSSIGRGIATIWKAFLAFCTWWLILLWNLGWLLFSIFCAFFAMICLMGIGTIVILWFQGYPMSGILLIVLGGFLCFGALSCGAFSLQIKRNGKTDSNTMPQVPEQTGKEVPV